MYLHDIDVKGPMPSHLALRQGLSKSRSRPKDLEAGGTQGASLLSNEKAEVGPRLIKHFK